MSEPQTLRFSEMAEETPIRIDVDGVAVCVVRLGDEVKAVHDTCSHQQWSLADGGMIWDNGVECSLHGSTFDLDDGSPSSLPAMKPIPTFEVTVEDDVITVDTSRARNGAPYPAH